MDRNFLKSVRNIYQKSIVLNGKIVVIFSKAKNKARTPAPSS